MVVLWWKVEWKWKEVCIIVELDYVVEWRWCCGEGWYGGGDFYMLKYIVKLYSLIVDVLF